MCGIAGWIENGCRMVERGKTLKAISETLERRGPDENGTYINGDTALIHRRLVVIDRENGKQPMSARHRDVTYVIVYNGELYNTAALREELRADGFHFHGHSDTEVVLKTYIKYGVRCGERLNGIFAFAVFNTKERSLFLCRDKIGVKPLFYHLYDGGLSTSRDCMSFSFWDRRARPAAASLRGSASCCPANAPSTKTTA